MNPNPLFSHQDNQEPILPTNKVSYLTKEYLSNTHDVQTYTNKIMKTTKIISQIK